MLCRYYLWKDTQIINHTDHLQGETLGSGQKADFTLQSFAYYESQPCEHIIGCKNNGEKLHTRNSQRNRTRIVKKPKKWKILFSPKAKSLSILFALTYSLQAWDNLSIKMSSSSTFPEWSMELVPSALTISYYPPLSTTDLSPVDLQFAQIRDEITLRQKNKYTTTTNHNTYNYPI